MSNYPQRHLQLMSDESKFDPFAPNVGGKAYDPDGIYTALGDKVKSETVGARIADYWIAIINEICIDPASPFKNPTEFIRNLVVHGCHLWKENLKAGNPKIEAMVRRADMQNRLTYLQREQQEFQNIIDSYESLMGTTIANDDMIALDALIEAASFDLDQMPESYQRKLNDIIETFKKRRKK